jgi:hypothetical protein
MISQLLLDLPDDYHYKVIFMRRKIEEVLASQKQMLIRRGTFKEDGISDDEMGKMLTMHVDQVLRKMESRDNVEMLCIDYNAMLAGAAASIARVNELLGGDLNTQAMTGAVDKSLYRQRK